MKNHKVRWTDRDGQPHVSVASYDEDSAKARKRQLVADGVVADAKDVRIVETKPGEVLQP
ncbi:hypothetical protein [Streptomyces sp. MMBL 11-3]|uniref:hypothetical protein n=1 Tax=Streptomyces sp. MMBL 11-3 TaxID=3382639 RepID=UPI0039B5DDE0